MRTQALCTHIFPGPILKDTSYLHVLNDVVCECEAGGVSLSQPDMWNAETLKIENFISCHYISGESDVMVNFANWLHYGAQLFGQT